MPHPNDSILMGGPADHSPPSAEDALSAPLLTDPHPHPKEDPIQSPVLIAGIAAAAAALLALIIWLTWVLLRSKRKKRAVRDDESQGTRPKLPPDWMTAVEHFKYVVAVGGHHD